MCRFDHTRETCLECEEKLKVEVDQVHSLSQEIKKAAKTKCDVLKYCEVSPSARFTLYELGRAGRGFLLGNATGVKT